MAAPKPSPIETIISLTKKQGVTIYLDGSEDSEGANAGHKSSYYKPDKILTIFLANLTDDEKSQLIPVVKEIFETTGLVLNDTQLEVVDSYYNYTTENPNQEILDFFEGKIPSDDFNALKMSLFMRSEKDRGANIAPYKNDIAERFGTRGIYIANLCNAGYFEREFIHLYNNNSPILFQRRYEILVGEKARAIFVHSGMTANILQTFFDSMVDKALKYHLADFRIHGFGWQNVEMIKNFLAQRIVDEDELFQIVKRNETNIPAEIEYEVIF